MTKSTKHPIKALDRKPAESRYALVDCAATAGILDDDRIYHHLSDPEIEKYNLLTGENAWTTDRTAPFLVPTGIQPGLEQWLLDKGWKRGWLVFFNSDAGVRTLLQHLRRFFEIEAENGRRVFFRFYDPVVMRDFLSLLTEAELACFLGPIDSIVMEDEDGQPLVIEKPDIQLPADLSPSMLVASKRGGFSAAWNSRLMGGHIEAYRAMGMDAFEGPVPGALTISEKDGARALLEKTSSGVAVTTGEGRVFHYELSTCKNPAAVIDPAGNRIDFDIQERESRVTGRDQSLLYAIRMEDSRKCHVFEYDEKNLLKRIDYPDGSFSLTGHDPHGNLRSFTDRNGHTTRYERDFYQRLTRMVDANGGSTAFSYEDLSAPSRITFADGSAFEFKYTDEGSLKSFLANNERVADYSVDPETGSWTALYNDGSRACFSVENGKIVRAENPAGTLILSYDDNGRLVSESFNNRTIIYERSKSGQLTGITAPWGDTVRFGRDGEQRVNSITDWNGRTIGVTYAENGALKTIEYPNGAILSQQNSVSGLPLRMTLYHADADAPIFDRRLTRDPLDRVTRMRDGKKAIVYNYDREGRLTGTRSELPEFCETFEIDAKANRLADGHGRYNINPADRIDQPGFAYDSLGNQISGSGPAGNAAYEWTSANRLASAAVGKTRATYVCDAFGRRVEKRVDGRITRTIWAGAQPLRDTILKKDGDRNIDYLFFPATPVLLAIRDETRIRYAAFGHRYETLCLTDLDGRTIWQADYDAFGNAVIEKGKSVFQPFRLAGQYLDTETGLHYCAARYYDPRLGRYLSPDPMFLEGGSDNFYAYCNGDPVNRLDPTGEFVFTAILVGASIGAAVGGAIEGYRQNKAGEETDGFKIPKHALIGGVIGAVGGGVGAAIEAGVAGTASASVLGKSALATMSATGFLSGTGGSVAEQCAEASATGNFVTPMQMVSRALADGLIGTVIGLAALGRGGLFARRIRKAAGEAIDRFPAAVAQPLPQTAPRKAPPDSPTVRSKARRNADHSEISTIAEPVNAVTGEVVLTQTDFTLPGRIPLSWTRHYGSQADYTGLLGRGWQSPADARLQAEDGMIVFYDGTPGGAVFEKLPSYGEPPLAEVAYGAELSATSEDFQVRRKSGIIFHFEREFSTDRSRVIRISDSSGNSLYFVRKNGALIAIEDSSGQRIRITCENGRISGMTFRGRPLVRYGYSDGDLATAVDALAYSRRFAYEKGRMIRHTDRNRLSFHYEYDYRGRCIHSFGDNGLYDYRFEYLPYQCCCWVTNSLGHVWQYHSDEDLLPVKVVDPTGAATVYTYDDAGRLTQVTDPLEQVSRYAYDPSGNVTEITAPDNSRMLFFYDEQHRPVQILGPNDTIRENQYDDNGRLVARITPLGHTTTYTYSRSGELLSATDPEDRSTAFEWDEHGHLKAVTNPAGDRRVYRRDLLGNITGVTDFAGAATVYTYDEKSRLLKAISPTGLAQRFEWDPEDNLLLHTDAAGRKTRFEYTGVNELARRINPDGTTVQYHYNTEEQLIAVTNERGQTYRFAYDAVGHVSARTDYWGHTHRYIHDPAGQLIKSIDPLEQAIAFTYDPAGRLTAKQFESEEQETFTWDPAGNLIAFESPDARVERLFDPDGRMILETSSGFEVACEYDGTGLRTVRTTSHGNRIAYTHDANGQVSAITINEQPPVEIERNSVGQITSEKFSEQLSRTYRYDGEGRLTCQQITSPLHCIERTFQYDAAGNRTAKTDSSKGNRQFTYDPMDRITESIDPMDQVKQYNHDPAGDLLNHLSEPQKGLRTATRKNRTYRFEAAGNLAEREQPKGLTRFTWDQQNRLCALCTPEGRTIDMAYDALGRRTKKSVNGERTTFTWDGDALLSEKYEDQPAREYVYYPGTFEPLVAVDATGQIYYYHNDPNGLPQELTRPDGTPVWSATYDALARVEEVIINKVFQPLRLQGQYLDPETGLCYNRHRYFAPHICAFISQDPLGLAAGENVYAYAPNVWGWVDPLGLSWYDNWHFEGRDALNNNIPATAEQAEPAGGTLLPPEMSKYHDNGIGETEQKFIFPDGREAVYDGDTGQLVTDPRFKGTYNYVNPAELSWNPLKWPEIYWRGLGHFYTDMLPYYMWGNNRPPDYDKLHSINRQTNEIDPCK